MYIADLHIHSKYSRATSRDLDLPHLDLWARRKGIALVATGDFTHPAWREELENALEPAEEGLYTLKPDLRLPCEVQGEAPRFVISGEISSIYKKNGKTRKVHSVILLPDLASAQALSQRLEAIGNIHSDGRPILGLDCRDLLEIVLDACPSAVFIPAHIWTPHFSLLGAFSGFDSLEECFGDLSGEIHAVETGLSSDPPMNWRVPDLDGLTLVSNSDAHSPAKLGREANLLDCALSYPAMAHAIQTGEGFCGTLEFYPEEGKYHLDGHRNCGVCLEPSEARKLGDVCPVCGRRLTIGVLHRVEALALRPEGARPEGAKPFESLVPLPELLSASLGAGAASRRVQEAYLSLLRALGDEMHILRKADPADIERVAGFAAAEGVRRLRAGRVRRKGGFDGEYGEISLFEPGELAMLEGQMALPGLSPVDAAREQRARERAKKEQKMAEASLDARETEAAQGEAHTPQGLNEAQRQAVETAAPHVAVIAGPGTGKTFTLVERIAYLVEVRGAKSAEITAVTFTRQAAEEMRARLEARLGGKKAVRGMNIGTFHAICLALLEKKPLLGESEARDVARGVLEASGSKGLSPRALVERVSQVKNGASLESVGLPEDLYRAYQARLAGLGARDLDDVLLEALEMDLAGKRAFTHVLVDEFQDINAVQRRLVRHFAAAGKTLFAIGDPDQSIYGFRGADAGCFAALARDWPDLQVIRLRENYRSTPQILAAALQAISANPGGQRELRAARPDGEAVRALLAPDAFSEGVFIAKEIGRMTGGMDMLAAHGGGVRETARAFSEIAVLCRTRRQLETIEACLRHDDIPCVIAGRGDFLQDDAVRAAQAFFASLLEKDAAAFSLALRLGYDCPAEEAEAAARAYAEVPSPLAFAQDAGDLGTTALWARDARDFAPRAEKEKPRKLLEGWCAAHGKNPALEKLLAAAAFAQDMPSFLNLLATGEEADIRRAAGKGYASGAVRLMTLHGAKGLEFPVVFLAGVSEGALPLEREDEPCDVEEERRLFFVGLTRAREELILTAAGAYSPFVQELPGDVRRASIPARLRAPAAEQLSLFDEL